MSTTNKDDELLTVDQVMQLIKVGRTWIYRHMKNGNFPKQIKLGSTSRWKKSDIMAYIESL